MHTCTVYVHYRFSSLFHDDKLGHCLDKDDPQLTLTTLQLLYQLVRSPSIAELICLHNDVACLPLICYQCLVDPTPNTNDKEIIFKIRLQVHVLVLQARHLYGSVVCLDEIGVPNRALGWFLLGFVEDKLFEFSCTCIIL